MKIAKYKVEYGIGDNYVVLQVDHDKLTPELAKEINEFFTGSEFRRMDCDGDDVQVVIRMFGSAAINWAFYNGGAYVEDPEAQWDTTTREVLDYIYEGWPPFEKLGIWIVEMYVQNTSFEDMTVERLG